MKDNKSYIICRKIHKDFKMKETTKTVLIKEALHAELKEYSEKTGIKMKVLV